MNFARPESSAKPLTGLAYYHDLFCETGERYRRSMRQPVVLELEVELENARAAIEFAGRSGQTMRAAELLVATPLWRISGLAAEETKRIQALLLAVDEDDAPVARLGIESASMLGRGETTYSPSSSRLGRLRPLDVAKMRTCLRLY